MKSIKNIIRSLEARKRQLAKTRDELRDLYNEVEHFHFEADEACADLASCIETLSRQV